MIPLIGTIEELKHQKAIVKQVAESTTKNMALLASSNTSWHHDRNSALPSLLTRSPRSRIFRFGTSDLTQMTFGYSRDDAGKFLQVTTTRKS